LYGRLIVGVGTQSSVTGGDSIHKYYVESNLSSFIMQFLPCDAMLVQHHLCPPVCISVCHKLVLYRNG